MSFFSSFAPGAGDEAPGTGSVAEPSEGYCVAAINDAAAGPQRGGADTGALNHKTLGNRGGHRMMPLDHDGKTVLSLAG